LLTPSCLHAWTWRLPCNGITEPEDPTPIGTYELASLDGNAVPYWFIDVFEDTITVSRATLVISANQRFFIEISGADSSLGNVDETYSGSWSTTIPTRIELRYTGTARAARPDP